jgi:hypothetical protein
MINKNKNKWNNYKKVINKAILTYKMLIIENKNFKLTIQLKIPKILIFIKELLKSEKEKNILKKFKKFLKTLISF